MLGDELYKKASSYASTAESQERIQKNAEEKEVSQYVATCIQVACNFFNSASPEELYKGKLHVSINYCYIKPITIKCYREVCEPIYKGTFFKSVVGYENVMKCVSTQTLNSLSTHSKGYLFYSKIGEAAKNVGLTPYYPDDDIVTLSYKYPKSN